MAGTDNFIIAIQTALHAIISIYAGIQVFNGITAMIEAKGSQNPDTQSQGGKTLAVGVALMVVGNTIVLALVELIKANMTAGG
jgi:hypothetical protein